MSANIAFGLKQAGHIHGNRPAVALGRTTLQSYSQLAERPRLADGLQGKLGLQPGDRIAIASKNRPEYVEAMYGVWWVVSLPQWRTLSWWRGVPIHPVRTWR